MEKTFSTKKVKVVIGYIPINSKKGAPLLSQNRQFQFFNAPTFIYPMVPAYLATMLKKANYKTYWLDGIAKQFEYKDWLNKLVKINPNYLVLEAKSPVIKQYWKKIDEIKSKLPKLEIILVGDHVTYLPIESFENSKVDYIVTGGDYDFVVLNLLNHIHKKEKLDGGIYYYNTNNKIKNKPFSIYKIRKAKKSYSIISSGLPSLKHNLDSLPFVDRDLTEWKLYAYKNGNYKYFPATYMYSGRDCWWNRCTFCVWDHTLNPLGSYRTMSPERIFSEVKYLVDKYNVKEIFDDAGTFIVGPRLKRFCELLIESGYNKKVYYGCNMRFNALKKEDCLLMKKANFRFILYGMESANQKTLDRIQKGIKVKEIENGAKIASQAGLDVHATIMLGYPWESLKDVKKTVEFTKEMFRKGYFKTMQATIVIPYPGTPLHKECLENNWLKTIDYEDYDMRSAVMKTPFPEEKLKQMTQELYSAFFSKEYIIRTILGIRSINDIKFLFIAGIKLVGHLLDFNPKKTKAL